jgi:transcriptional regulator with XRE-family HTH domain
MHMRPPESIMREMADADELKQTTLRWVREILEHTGYTPSALARESEASQSSLSRFLNGDAETLSNQTLAKIARVSPVAIPRQIQAILDRHPGLRIERSVNTSLTEGENVPVYGVIPVARDGEFALNPVALTFFRRAAGARTSRKLIAFYAPDETMAPRWQPGEPIFVDLARPGAQGEYVLIKLAALEDQPNETETYLFRRYDGRRSGLLNAGALDGTSDACIPISRVLEVRRALTWSDMTD